MATRRNGLNLIRRGILSFVEGPQKAAAAAFPRGFTTRAAGIPLARVGTRMSAMTVPESTFAAGAVRPISVEALQPSDRFAPRHNSLTPEEMQAMVKFIGFDSMDDFITATVPKEIRRSKMDLGKYEKGYKESEFLAMFKEMMSKNQQMKSYIGMGYYGTHVPGVILRNVLENPGWYTQYTPYQGEIAQGRLESLLNFQTMVTDLTAMPMSNASLLDEGTAAAEAMTMCSAIARGKKPRFLVSSKCHPQTIDVVVSRADGLGLVAEVVDEADMESKFASDVCGLLLQYPATDGSIGDYAAMTKAAQAQKIMVCAATDLLSLTMITPPGEWGADIVVGSAQRFGVPMGYGGPHAAFLATSEEYKRIMPGRIIGVSVDAQGNPALRMAMQTREQHIRRDKATSNICTAQALLANMAGLFAVYHGPAGLKEIATRVHGLAAIVAAGATKLGLGAPTAPFFDTVTIACDADAVVAEALKLGANVRKLDAGHVSIAVDETTSIADVDDILTFLNKGAAPGFTAESLAAGVPDLDASVSRKSSFLQHPIFNSYHTEHEMLRYLKRLENKDMSLAHSMCPLGSCTMKLNSTAEMIPVTWAEAAGYNEMFADLADQLCEITGFDSMSLQPNSGASGEYAGLMSIRAYHQSNGDHHRNVCIIPVSAHGTNPASAVMAGMKILPVGTDKKGNINMDELFAAAEKHKDNLAALMITYPSTHGVYEEGVERICAKIHECGGQVYMDGANMNAQVGITSPGFIGADVCHLNLHKTFCIPHGGGGPGMGPIGVKSHLAPFLPSHPVIPTGGLPAPSTSSPYGTTAAAPFGSSSILPISFAYIAMMGGEGLTVASQTAMLSANYMAKRLEEHYPILFRGKNGTCAHEFILDLRPLKETSGVEAEDVAKRLMDYGFHAPTMSWPVPGTLMVEPTESESKAELDRFVNAMIAIRDEIREVENGSAPKENNVLKNAPHTAAVVMGDEWDKPYTREAAAFPASWVAQAKFWPTVSRIDNVYGDRNLVTTAPLTAPAEELVA